MVKVLAFSGSGRRQSYNQRLVAIAAAGAHRAGAEVTLINLQDLNLPIFNEDEEAEKGLPPGAVGFKRLLRQHDGWLIACPEYNSSITPLLKNAIDWASRPEPNGAASPFRGKTTILMSASPGQLGGLRGLFHVRDILYNLGTIILPQQRSLTHADLAFNDHDQLQDEAQQEAFLNLGRSLVSYLERT
ncbi:NAD(P)H-dependent oxidoreductase [Synechococcus elongatus IITB4]|uniref:NADPH-dependent FMN reductase n=1 Tax=Synechococcus elongatus TaxID=32046 RepID=UPI0030CEAC73